MKYPMSEQDWNDFNKFMLYAASEGDHSLTNAVRAFISEGDQSLDQRRKNTLLIASMASNIAIHAFNALEETSRTYEEGRVDQMFRADRMAILNRQLNDLTSDGSYEFMTNQSAMRKVFSALTDFMNNHAK